VDTAEQGRTPMDDVAPMRQLSPATQPIRPAKFAHFVLRTGQLETMANWYQTVLAARVVFRDERLCFLSYDDEHHRVALINIPGRAFAENPVGVTYEPEELCRRYEAGEAMTDLLRIPPLPKGKTPWDMLARH